MLKMLVSDMMPTAKQNKRTCELQNLVACGYISATKID